MRNTKFCPSSRKYRFRDHAEAVQALHNAQNARRWAALDDATTRRHETRAYQCRECNGWHLTSQAKRVTSAPSGSAIDGSPRGSNRSQKATTGRTIPPQLTRRLHEALSARQSAKKCGLSWPPNLGSADA